MKYTVYLDKKVVEYDEDLPGGHLIALKKVFEPQGYNFVKEPILGSGLREQIENASLTWTGSSSSMWGSSSGVTITATGDLTLGSTSSAGQLIVDATTGKAYFADEKGGLQMIDIEETDD